MRKFLSTVAVGAMMLASAAQAQEQAAVFKPTAAWALDYGDDYCRLMRTFSDGKEEVALGLERIRPGSETRLVLVGDGIKTFRRAERLGYNFLPNQAEREAMYTRSVTSDGKQYLNLGTLTLASAAPAAPGAAEKYDRVAEAAAAKAITGVAISKGLTTPARIETGALDAPVAALQACADDLVKSWGLDAEKHKTLEAQPVPQGSPWLPTGTIGFGDFGKLTGGSNQIRLLVDASGKPTACHVHWPTLDKSANDKICGTLMEKASFTPAKDAAGQAVASYWMGSPMFMMPAPGGGRRGR